MADSDEDDKQHEPTQKKLDDARRKGDIAKSADLNTAAAYGGLLIAAISVGASSIQSFVSYFSGLVARADTTAQIAFSSTGETVFNGLIRGLISSVLPWFVIPGLAVLGVIIAQRSFVVAPEKITFKLNRISPLANAKNKFGRSGLFEFAKSFSKLMIYSVALGIFLQRQFPGLVETIPMAPRLVPVIMLRLCISFLLIVLLISASVGAIDFLWQYQEHMRKNRMSRKEMTDEMKQSEGDPHVKNQRRQKGYEIAMNQMLAAVPEADVVIVNPTHYAVALKWSRLPGEAPICVAKGTDEIARRIREVAAEAGVPVHRDPPVARAIFAVVEIGNEIHPDHYEAVAAAIRFAEAMRKRAKFQAGARL